MKTREKFIKKYATYAIHSTYGTGLFPSVKMAQAIIESASSSGKAGQSSLAKKYNNFFGIKSGSSWEGKSIDLATGEFFSKKKQQSLTVSGCTALCTTAFSTTQNFY
ncbi:glucosaminidase domain-containing protein [Candidatus Gracilibacteria bacterium]|nr:glucosaminidase domain-containing protein [Candidatus Gracilibacteria bacterium]